MVPSLWLNVFILASFHNVWITICDECLLNKDDFNFDFRGIIFQDTPEIFSCADKNILPSDNLHVEEINIDVDDFKNDISVMLCPNITTNGDVSLSPKVSLSNGEFYAQPRVNTGNDLYLSAEFSTQSRITLNPILNLNNKITYLKPKFSSFSSSFNGIPILSSNNDIVVNPVIFAEKSVILYSIINTFGTVILEPDIECNGPVILYTNVINSSQIILNTKVTAPNEDIYLISSLNTVGDIILNTTFDNGPNGNIIFLPTSQQSIFLGNNFLFYTKNQFDDFIFQTNFNVLRMSQTQKDGNKGLLFRFLFSFRISTDDVFKVDINSNYLDVYERKLILGRIDENNNNVVLKYQNFKRSNFEKIEENTDYDLKLMFDSDKKIVSLFINDELLFMTKSRGLYDNIGNIGIYSFSTLLNVYSIQCIQALP